MTSSLSVHHFPAAVVLLRMTVTAMRKVPGTLPASRLTRLRSGSDEAGPGTKRTRRTARHRRWQTPLGPPVTPSHKETNQ